MEMSQARLFVGIPIEARVRAELEAYLAAAFPDGVPGRAVPAANWHLTLRFLGATDAERHRRLGDELRRIALPPFELGFTTLGAFPRAARATVLWVGVGDGDREVRALAASIEAAAVRAGFTPEPKPYSPHLPSAASASPPTCDAPSSARPRSAGGWRPTRSCSSAATWAAARRATRRWSGFLSADDLRSGWHASL